MDFTDYDRQFREIVRRKHGREVDFAAIEARLGHLREGAPLSCEDLTTIGDDRYWPFSNYWMWPPEDRIAGKLAGTGGWLRQLPGAEERVIADLDSIFKNISLVSIILRFVHPEHYAIYSRPMLKVLRIERGHTDTEEYLNYVRVMRMLTKSYGVARTADIDTIVWAITKLRGKAQKGLLQALAYKLPECLTPGELLEFYEHDPFKIARLYFAREDHKTAGYWTAIALDRAIDAECPSCVWMSTTRPKGQMEQKIEWICENRGLRAEYELLERMRKLRNKAIHPGRGFSREDAGQFIDDLQRLLDSIESLRNAADPADSPYYVP